MNFPDIDWINDNFATRIEPQKIVSTLSFSVLWNIFEFKICNKKFNIDKIAQHVNYYNIPLEKFTIEIKYFMKRSKSFTYDENNIIDYIEKGLLIPPFIKDKENKLQVNKYHTLVKSFLYEEALSEQDKIKALFYIIYRLRNNMFHGEKDLMNLHLQEVNFINANSAIKTMLSYIR